MHEMPDLFRMGEYWYLLTTEYSDQCKTVYRMSRSLAGPWTAPLDDAFDGRAYYAARSCSDGSRRYLFGWVPTKENDDDLANWQWGGTLVVHEVYQRADGSLGVQAPEGVQRAFGRDETLLSAPLRMVAEDACTEMYLCAATGDLFKLDVEFTIAPGTRALGLRLFEDQESGDAYEYRLNLGEQRVIFDRTPNLPWFRYMNKGLERPFRLEPERKAHLQLIVEDTIATLYLDGVALNTRMYHKAGQALAL